MKFTFHCLGLPHTVTNSEYVACAYTQKVLKFCKMMTERGHTVYHYGHEDSDVICTEHISVTTNQDLEIAYGTYDWRNKFFTFDTSDHAYRTFYENAILEVATRKQPNDFILAFWGSGVRPVCDAHNDLIVVEPGIGYSGGHWAKWKVFESYSLLHAYQGLAKVGRCNPDWYEVVIPNYFDVNDFDYSEKKEDYILFLSRIYEGKGIHIAEEVTAKTGHKLVVAGQNNDDRQFPDHVEFVGYADKDKRRELMRNARALIVPSMYNEPFGGVQVEALLSGTPTITTDWGAFTENNPDCVTGFRCRTFQDFVDGVNNAHTIDPKVCREHGLKYTLENIAPRYEKYFQDVYNVYTGNGWYQMRDELPQEEVKETPKAISKKAVPPRRVNTTISEPEKPTLELKPKPQRPKENVDVRNTTVDISSVG